MPWFVSQTVTLKKDNLIKTGTSCGLDFAQGWSDLFVFSTGEEMFSIEIGANPEIVDMNNLVDMNTSDADAKDRIIILGGRYGENVALSSL